jgi:hypothetical protein
MKRDSIGVRGSLSVGALALVALGALAAPGCAGEESSAADGEVGKVQQALEGVACVTIERGSAYGVEDTYLQNDDPDSPRGSLNHLQIAPSSKALLRFDLSGIPAGASLSSATLTLDAFQGDGGTVTVHHANASWTEAAATYTVFVDAFDSTVVASFPGTPGSHSVDVLASVQGWVSGAQANEGFYVQGDEWSAAWSSETTEGGKPRLVACYYLDEDGDGSPSNVDCDDHDASVHPGAAEVCDDRDNDCDDQVDEGGVCTQTEFTWEASADGFNWFPVTLPDTNFGCTFCTRYYRTYVSGAPSDVTFRWGSDNEARMFVNGDVAFDDYYVQGIDFCTELTCCSQCCDTPANCFNVVANQTPHSLGASALSLFGAGVNEIKWQVNQQTGGSGFYTVMAATF